MSHPYETLTKKIFEAAEKNESEALFKSIVLKYEFYKVVELYTYFRDASPETQNFRKLQKLGKKLHDIITNKALDPFWFEVLQKKNGYKAFKKIPPFKRHRLEDQSGSDGLHPFKIIAGYYYDSRYPCVHQYLLRLVIASSRSIHQGKYKKAFDELKKGFKGFKPVNEKWKEYQKKIQEQIDLLESYNLDDKASLPKINEACEIIFTQINFIRMENDKLIEIGIKYGYFLCFYNAQMLDIDELLYLYYTETFSEYPKEASKITKLILRLEKRADAAANLHGTAGYLLRAFTHYKIGRTYQKAKKSMVRSKPYIMLDNTILPTRFFTLSAGRKELQNTFLEMEETHFKKAIRSAKTAKDLHASLLYSDITDNAVGGALSCLLLKFRKEEYKTIEDFIQRLIKETNYKEEPKSIAEALI